MYLDYFECSLTLKNKRTNKYRYQLGSGESDSLKLPSFFSCWSMGLVHRVGTWDVFSWISRQFFFWNLKAPIDFRCLETYMWLQSGSSAWLPACSAPYFKERKHGPHLLPSLSCLKDLAFPFGNTWNYAHFPPFLPPFPSHSRTLFLIFLIPVGTADNFESQDYWLCLLLLRSLQGLQVSTKLWAFSQFTHRFIICWHCFAINRSTFTDIIDSTASLLTNTLFNVSNLPSYFT